MRVRHNGSCYGFLVNDRGGRGAATLGGSRTVTPRRRPSLHRRSCPRLAGRRPASRLSLHARSPPYPPRPPPSRPVLMGPDLRGHALRGPDLPPSIPVPTGYVQRGVRKRVVER